MNFTPIGTILSFRLNDLIIYAQFLSCNDTHLVIKEWVYRLILDLDNQVESETDHVINNISQKYNVAADTISKTIIYLLTYQILLSNCDNSKDKQFSISEDTHVLNNVLRFSYQKTIISGKVAQMFGKFLCFLFCPISMVLVAIIFALLSFQTLWIGVFKYNLLIDPNQTLVYGALSLPVVVALNWIKTFFHEFGHISATIKCGETPGEIGFGVYMFTPVLYSNVCSANTTDRKKRLTIDIGGITIDCLLLSCLAIIVMLIDNIYVYSIQFILLTNEFNNFDPFKKTDGYWIYSDYFNLPNLHNRLEEMVISIFKIRKKSKDYRPKFDKAIIAYGVYCLAIIFFSVCSGFVFLPSYIKSYPLMISEYWNRLVVAIQQNMAGEICFNFYLLASLLACLVGFFMYLKTLCSFVIKRWRSECHDDITL